MESEKFNLVFRGQILPRQELDVVKQNMAALFKLPMATIEKLFSGSDVVLKKNLDLAAANRYRVAIKKAGARVELVKVTDQASPSVPASNASASPEADATPVNPTPLSAGDQSQAPVVKAQSASEQDPKASAEPKSAFEVLSAGEDLLREDERSEVVPVRVDTSGITLKESGGNLVDEGELGLALPVAVADLQADILPAGTALLSDDERSDDEVLSVADLDVDILPSGTDLIAEEERQQVIPVAIPELTAGLAAVGERLSEEKEELVEAPNVDHIRLAD